MSFYYAFQYSAFVFMYQQLLAARRTTVGCKENNCWLQGEQLLAATLTIPKRINNTLIGIGFPYNRMLAFLVLTVKLSFRGNA